MPSNDRDLEEATITLMAMGTMAAMWLVENGTPPELSEEPMQPEHVMADCMRALMILGVPQETIGMLIGRATIGAL